MTWVEQALAEVGVLSASTRFINPLLIVTVVARGSEAKMLVERQKEQYTEELSANWKLWECWDTILQRPEWLTVGEQ